MRRGEEEMLNQAPLLCLTLLLRAAILVRHLYVFLWWGREGRLFFIKIEEIAGTHLQCAGKLDDVIEADILLAALHLADKIPVRLDHLAELLLRKAAFRADGTEAFAER